MRPPHTEPRRRGFSGHRTGRSIMFLACIGVALVFGAVARSAAGVTAQRVQQIIKGTGDG